MTRHKDGFNKNKVKDKTEVIIMLTKYVNVFHGNGEITPKPQGIAKKWYFLKAGTGNTSPAAMVPFGAMSVAPYSGGYPTGYGNHLVNTHSHPKKFDEGKGLLGFAHLQQSGTGTIGYYYNYALVTPAYEDSAERREPKDETGAPGYYACKLEDIKCELTSTARTALHRYTFGKEGGKVTVDFSNNGLRLPGEEKKEVKGLKITCLRGNFVTAEANIEGIDIYFALYGEGEVTRFQNKVEFEGFGNTCNLRLVISLAGTDEALRLLRNDETDFDAAKQKADEIWEDALGRFEIDTDEKAKEKFYSNLYHSLVKPCDWTGDSFVYSKAKPFVTDYATLWDMYKTALPLVLMCYEDMGSKVCESLMCLCDVLGEMPNGFGLSSNYIEHSTQARTLGAYVLMTAYRYGVKIDPHRMVKCIDRDVFAPNKTDFTVEGKCASNTWLLDMADCCALCAEIAKEIGENEIALRLEPLADQWVKAYDKETGLLSDDSSYYEGTKYNYSFRQMVKMDERIALAGGKEKFVELLDRFFGYGAADVTLPTDPDRADIVNDNYALGRFEGFNNESDTEAPFSYIYAGRHDRTVEIVRAGLDGMFTTGTGAIPGNNDSGAMSSYYVLTSLGLFPVAGQNLFLLGAPIFDRAKIKLFNGKEIEIVNNSENEKATFNGKEVSNFMLKADELMQGGTLIFG